VWAWLRALLDVILGLPPCRLRVIVVNLKSDPDNALEGVLWSARGDWYVLRNGALVNPNADPDKRRIPAEGELVIHRGNIAYLQVF